LLATSFDSRIQVFNRFAFIVVLSRVFRYWNHEHIVVGEIVCLAKKSGYLRNARCLTIHLTSLEACLVLASKSFLTLAILAAIINWPRWVPRFAVWMPRSSFRKFVG
jgi:hypothetical protein